MILDMSPHSPTNPKAHVQGFQPAFHCFKYEQSTKVPGYLKTASGVEGRDLNKEKENRNLQETDCAKKDENRRKEAIINIFREGNKESAFMKYEGHSIIEEQEAEQI